MQLRRKLDVADAGRQLVRGLCTLGIIKRHEAVLRVDLSQICSKSVTIWFIGHHHTWEHNNRRGDCDVKMELGSSLLYLCCLVCRSLTSCIENCLHLAELDGKLHNLTERLCKEVDLNRACFQCDSHVVPRIALRIWIEGLVAKIGQILALDSDQLTERRFFGDTLIDIIDERQISKTSTDAHRLAAEEYANISRVQTQCS